MPFQKWRRMTAFALAMIGLGSPCASDADGPARLRPEDTRHVSGRSDDQALDGPMNATQQARADALTPGQLEAIDRQILRSSDVQWRKVARIVADLMLNDWPGKPDGMADVFYAQRVARLVQQGQLESQGNLRRMRFSEVKLRR